MIPTHRVNEAYDALNLPRDAPMQTVRDRFAVLSERLKGAADTVRLEEVRAAFKVLEQADAALRTQREMIANQSRSRSERELDGKLTELTAKITIEKRPSTVPEECAKKQKIEESNKSETKEEPSNPSDDSKVFEKLNALLKEGPKFLRAVNVLANMVKAMLEKRQFDPQTIRMLTDSLDTMISSSSTTDRNICLCNASDENRRAVTRAVNLIFTSDELKQRIPEEFTKVLSHAVLFRNSLYELDNFNFVKKCKEVVSMVSSVKLPPQSDEDERWLAELVKTLHVLCSKPVCKFIPGRFNDAKSTMTEIFKISRRVDYPQEFRDSIAELQKEIMSL